MFIQRNVHAYQSSVKPRYNKQTDSGFMNCCPNWVVTWQERVRSPKLDLMPLSAGSRTGSQVVYSWPYKN